MALEYRFTNSWFQIHAKYWSKIFNFLKWNSSEEKVIVEIGSFEGQSTCWILNNLVENPSSRVYCLDTFTGSAEHKDSNYPWDMLFETFQHNISVTGKAEHVYPLIGDSKYNLSHLVSENVVSDFVYVDGSHECKDVLADAVLAWMILKPGGLLIFDDYLWWNQKPSLGPKFAIDCFVNFYREEIDFLDTGEMSQFCILKRR
jgi:predicted O-methyltransferase YrrM